MTNWDELETFVKAVAKVQMQETLSPHFGKIAERIENLEQGGGLSTDLNNRVADLEEQIASLKVKLANPPTLKNPEPQQPALAPKKQEQPQQPQKKIPAKTFFNASEWE